MAGVEKPRSFIERLAHFVAVFADEQRRDDACTQEGLNGHRFLAKLACAPELRRVAAFISFHEAAARHKLALIQEIMEQARDLCPGAGSSLGVLHPEPGAPAHRVHALELYRLALALDPECAPARFNMGRMYEDAGQAAEAISFYAEASRQQPCFRPHVELRSGLLLDAAGLPEDALARVRAALAAQTTFGELHARCARVMRRGGDIEAALEAYGKTVQTDHYCAPEFAQLDPPSLELAHELFEGLLPRSSA